METMGPPEFDSLIWGSYELFHSSPKYAVFRALHSINTRSAVHIYILA